MSRILLIDDDLQVSEVLQTSIELLGHTVKTAENGDAALAVLADFKPDFTLVDMMMPGLSGIELLKEIQNSNPEIISCLTTGLSDPKLLEQALQAGGWFMMSKPFNLAELVDLIRTATLLSEALKMEAAEPVLRNPLQMVFEGVVPVSSRQIADLVKFAHIKGAPKDVADRRLPVVAAELLRNAWEHGTKKLPENHYGARLTEESGNLTLEVFNSGAGFDWKRALIKTRVRTDKSRASGLQIAKTLSDDFSFDAKGKTAIARFAKSR